jgi:hypothetical protein
MPGTDDVVIRSFAGGEVSPAIAARADLARYQTGLRTCRNFIVQRNGGAANRPGTRFVGECKTADVNVKLLRYTAANEGESVLIEAGETYLRFYLNGVLVVLDLTTVDDWDSGTAYVIGDLVKRSGIAYYAKADGTNHQPPNATYWYPLTDGILEIPTPFSDDGLFNWSQSGQTITLTHRLHPPQELIYESITRWIFRAVTTAPRVDAPTTPALANTVGTRSYGYVITAAAPGTYEESLASAQVIDASALAPSDAAPHSISWVAVTVDGVSAPEYYVYCDPYSNGQYGFIGTAVGVTTFKNNGIVPDFNQTPPLAVTPFGATGDYPHVSATYQQRRFFGQTVNEPDLVEGSRLGFASNFGISSPLQDDDALSFKIAGNNHNAVRHLLALKAGLVVMTGAGEWTVNGPQGAPLSPNAIDPEQQTYVGAAEDVRPAIIGNGIVYAQARGSKVHELRFDQQVEGLGGRDLTVFAAHLFDGFSLLAMDVALAPNSIVWAVRSDGTLLGLTYVPEQDVWGWHRHDTQGVFRDVCVVPEVGEDAAYFIVARTVNGSTVMYIERMASRTIIDFNRDSFFVDAGVTYDGTPVASISGLDHLEGKVVAVVADGVVQYNGATAGAGASAYTVTGGAVNIGTPASVVHVGLAILYPEIETVSLDVAGSAIRGKVKRVQAVTALINESSRTFWAGPDTSRLTQYRAQPFDGAAKSFEGAVELNVAARFNADGRVFVRQTDPLPITILGLIPSVELGG